MKAYFVTIKAQQARLLNRSELSTILEKTWYTLPRWFPGIILDEFIVMANYAHFILWFDAAKEHAPTLSSILRAYQSLTTLQWLRYRDSSRMVAPGLLWLPGYYSRVIADPVELEELRKHIRGLPLQVTLPLQTTGTRVVVGC
ncbi:hypothetical protein EPA93_27140 [Ktedonosporobacter rubrisoli]|uniref:Transposase IS200-like domain-containing protein n=1 Tax=Ktedonosporobacter rubrisoli TaxID=2509675 RepID=A0A4P6JUY4_KTERU|nr:hypothetical protein [Ktedonosporobacter rubrisoli]QBD79459.1 hypothetical protein EPA93_27140 [Ktedonosporobacter rubrisoli]